MTETDLARDGEKPANDLRARVRTVLLRRKLTENGELSRIASHIQTEKTLNYLFEHATKKAE